MFTRILALGALLGLGVSPSFGATITNGVVDFSGSIYVTSAQSTAVATPAGTCPANQACIFWADSSGNNPSGYPGVLGGDVDISSAGLPNGDVPAGISGNDAATISSIVNPSESVGGSGFSPQLFMAFENDSITTTLSIDFIAPGVLGSSGCADAPPAGGQVCSPSGSPFNFMNISSTSSAASYLFSGITSAGGTWSASFTSAFASDSFQEVLGNLATNGYFQDTFAAQLTMTGPAVVAPEPGELGMLMIGLGLLGVALRRRQFVRSL